MNNGTKKGIAREGRAVEPVAYGDPQAFVNFAERGDLGGVHGREWMWAKPDAGLVALYDQPAIDTLRAQLEAAERYKVAFEEWSAKTEWLQETAKPRELGKHRADVLRERVQSAEARAEAAEAKLAEISKRGKWVPVKASDISARTKEATP